MKADSFREWFEKELNREISSLNEAPTWKQLGKALPGSWIGRPIINWLRDAKPGSAEYLRDPRHALNFRKGHPKWNKTKQAFLKEMEERGIEFRNPRSLKAIDHLITQALNGRQVNFKLVAPALKEIYKSPNISDEVKEDFGEPINIVNILDEVIKTNPDLWFDKELQWIYPDPDYLTGKTNIDVSGEFKTAAASIGKKKSSKTSEIDYSKAKTAEEAARIYIFSKDLNCVISTAEALQIVDKLSAETGLKKSGDNEVLPTYDNPNIDNSGCRYTDHTAVDILNGQLVSATKDRAPQACRVPREALISILHDLSSERRIPMGDIEKLYYRGSSWCDGFTPLISDPGDPDQKIPLWEEPPESE